MCVFVCMGVCVGTIVIVVVYMYVVTCIYVNVDWLLPNSVYQSVSSLSPVLVTVY